MKAIIDIKKYKQLQKLLAGSQEDKTLALTIIDNSDFEKSFIPILCLMSQNRDNMYAYGSLLGKCHKLCQYLAWICNNPNHEETVDYVIDIDLNWILKMYKNYRQILDIPESLSINKFILNEYQTFEVNPMYSFKAQLNPKKKI